MLWNRRILASLCMVLIILPPYPTHLKLPIYQNLTGGVSMNLHITEPTNASRTLLMDLKTLNWSESLLQFFSLRPSILPRLVSSSEVVGTLASGPLGGVRIAGLIGDQQGALVGNKCLRKGEAKCTYGTGAFLLFNTGRKIVKSDHGLLTTVAYQPGPGKKASYALEGSSKFNSLLLPSLLISLIYLPLSCRCRICDKLAPRWDGSHQNQCRS